MLEHITVGVICIKDCDIVYHLAKIEYHKYEDDSEKYIFIPYWNIIDLLPSNLFQGIPGLNMDLRLEKYERDKIPVFIAERTPSENRVDLWDLLEACNMTYLNRLEWLIRTDLEYFGDNLYVIRYEDSKEYNKVNDLTTFNYQDKINIDSIFNISNKEETIIKILLKIVASGSYLNSKELHIDDNNRASYFNLLYSLNKRNFDLNIIKQRGRPKVNVSFFDINDIYSKYLKGELSRVDAMNKLNIKSESTFYRRIKEYKNMINN